MPKQIVLKLKEMKEKKDPSPAKNHSEEFGNRFIVSSEETPKPVEVAIKFACLDAELQTKIISLMQAILNIGNAAGEVYLGTQPPFVSTYFCPIVNAIDLSRVLSSFQTVLYSSKELPILDGVFWPGLRGAMLSEISFKASNFTFYALNYDMDQTGEAWSEISARIQIALSTWSDERADIDFDNYGFPPEYWWEDPIYQNALIELDSKVDHVISLIPQIASKMNEWAEERRDLVIQQKAYEEILCGNAEEEIDFDTRQLSPFK
jgi:hypothetical protein